MAKDSDKPIHNLESERQSLKASDKKEEVKGKPKPKPEEPKVPKVVTYGQLFKYCTRTEKFLLFVAALMGMSQGALMPVMTVVFGDMTLDFTPNKGKEAIKESASKSSLTMFYLGLGCLFAAFTGTYIWTYIGKTLSLRVRKLYFQSLINQDIGFYDVTDASKMTTAYVEDLYKFDGGVGDKHHGLFNAYAMTLSGFAVGFAKGWWFAIIVTLSFPVMMIGMIGFAIVMQKENEVNKKNYEEAGSCSEQGLSAIKTVKSLCGEDHEVGIYDKTITSARVNGVKFSILAGISFGFFYFTLMIAYGLNYYIGSVLVDKNVWNHNASRTYNVADIITIFFAVTTGGFAMGQASPASKGIALAQAAAYDIYKVIERKTKIAINDEAGIKPSDIEGSIEFKNVEFTYPSRQGVDNKVLRGVDLVIPKGKRVALVGETGCGKSTTVQLIERFYDPDVGSVSIDGKDLKSYNLTALRKFIGYVGQEPVLFAMSIRDNLLLAKPDAKDPELYDALRKANAYQFVQNLENKIDTYVGSGGSQLSGGQKQRISIARSILQDPKILLLDEATSALDRKNEREIQETLEKFSNGRTTVTIAHRLSTIINSDIIFVLEKGRVVEQGTHQNLLEKNGIYAKLVRFQLDGQSLDTLQKTDQGNGEKFTTDFESTKDIKGVTVEEDSMRGVTKKVMTDEQKKAQKALDSQNNKKFFGQLRQYLNGNYGILVLGCLCALAGGCIMPVFAVFMADMIDVLSKFDLLRNNIAVEGYTFDRLKTDSLYIGLYFLILAFVSFGVYLGQFAFFGLLGQRITYKLRLNLYKHLITRDMAFFDKKENNPGELTAVLAKDCLTVNAIVSSSYSAILNGTGSFICGTLIAMFASWRIALISLCVSPIMILAGVIESSKLHKSETPPGEEDTTETKIFQESTTNMRTINSMNSQNLVMKMFNDQCDVDYKLRIGSIIFNTSLYAIGQFSMFAVYALIFYVGAVFTMEYNLSFQDLFRALFAVIFSAFGVGMSTQFMGNVSGAKTAAKKIFAILNIPNDIKQKENPVTKPITGNIEFRNVAFTYPTRKEPVFHDVSFKIDSKQKVAFVGTSGCGKSSIYGLIMRFYDVDKGEVLIDGVNIKDYDIKTLRSGLGIVSQEPTLFNNTIEYNIRYNRENLGMKEIEEASKTANAYNFITSDQKQVTSDVDKIVVDESEKGDGQGFERKVGIKGGKLSGGQKQRIAIARAVVRKPQVYMFDEATSALDTESERIVQDAINKLITQDTSLTIAHRISTVKDSDIIYVIDHGTVVEQGTYSDLMSKKGVFYTISKDK